MCFFCIVQLQGGIVIVLNYARNENIDIIIYLHWYVNISLFLLFRNSVVIAGSPSSEESRIAWFQYHWRDRSFLCAIWFKWARHFHITCKYNPNTVQWITTEFQWWKIVAARVKIWLEIDFSCAKYAIGNRKLGHLWVLMVPFNGKMSATYSSLCTIPLGSESKETISFGIA